MASTQAAPLGLLQLSSLLLLLLLAAASTSAKPTWEDCGSELATIVDVEPYAYSGAHGYIRFGFHPKEELKGPLRTVVMSSARNGTVLPREEYDLCTLAHGCPLPASHLVHLLEFTKETNKVRFFVSQRNVVVLCLDVDLDRADPDDPPPDADLEQLALSRDGYEVVQNWRDCGSARTQPQSVFIRGDSIRISFHMQAAIEDPSPMELKARGETLQKNLCEMSDFGMPACPVPPQSVLLQLPLPPKPPVYARDPRLDDDDYEWSRFIAWEGRRHGTIILCVEFQDA